MSTHASLPYAFVAKIVAADGQHDALGDLLASAVELANEEEGTIVWFAVCTFLCGFTSSFEQLLVARARDMFARRGAPADGSPSRQSFEQVLVARASEMFSRRGRSAGQRAPVDAAPADASARIGDVLQLGAQAGLREACAEQS